MTPFKNCKHYNEYESYIISFFIIMFNEDEKLSLSKVFISALKLTMYLHIQLKLKVDVICVWMLRIVWAMKNIFFCACHVLKAWCLRTMEKIKDVEVWRIILHDLHDVMYMSIEPKENIDTFKKWRRMKVLQSFE